MVRVRMNLYRRLAYRFGILIWHTDLAYRLDLAPQTCVQRSEKLQT